MVFKIILQSSAKEELREVIEYYNEISPELSEDVTKQFYSSLELITETPYSFQKIKGQFRKVNLHRFPYKIIYIVKAEEVTVVAVAHQKRRPFYWRGR